MIDHPHLTPPSAADLQRLVASELSRTSRVGHIALLLIALAVVVATASLWLTEEGLPLRTHLAFGALTIIGVCWVAHAWWVLTTRRPLLATHRVVAARMAVVFSAAFSISAAILAFLAPPDAAAFCLAALRAAAVGGVMCLVAAGLLRQATRRVEALRSRRAALEHQMSR